MTITYEIENNLYVNVTNQCSNTCNFCVRNLEGAFDDDLWLEKEPTSDEIIADIFARDLSKYEQIVFCGFGEPLEKIDEVIKVCKGIRAESDISIRINTNGQANLIHNVDITPRLNSLVDSISISLNAKNSEDYDAVCHSYFGKNAFSAILDFTSKCKRYIGDVQLSIVDCLPQEDIILCQKIAADLGVNLKIRKLIK